MISDKDFTDVKGPEIISVKNYRDIFNNSNLHIAVMNKSIKLVKYFIDKDMDINDKNNYGQTPLHLAMNTGNIEIIKLLIDKGADLIIVVKNGNKPFDVASKK